MVKFSLSCVRPTQKIVGLRSYVHLCLCVRIVLFSVLQDIAIFVK